MVRMIRYALFALAVALLAAVALKVHRDGWRSLAEIRHSDATVTSTGPNSPVVVSDGDVVIRNNRFIPASGDHALVGLPKGSQRYCGVTTEGATFCCHEDGSVSSGDALIYAKYAAYEICPSAESACTPADVGVKPECQEIGVYVPRP